MSCPTVFFFVLSHAIVVFLVFFLYTQDVLALRTSGKSNIIFQLVHPTKRHLEDLEMEFDFSDAKVRDEVYKVREREKERERDGLFYSA